MFGDFSDRSKAIFARKKVLREMTKQLREERQEHSQLEKIIFLLDKQQMEQYGYISR